MSLEHSTLPLRMNKDELDMKINDGDELLDSLFSSKNSTYLTSETVKEQKEEQEHNACPFGTRLLSIYIKVKR